MKAFIFSICTLASIVALFALYSWLGPGFHLSPPAPPQLMVSLQCPDDLLDGQGLHALRETGRVIRANNREIRTATIMVDHMPAPGRDDPFRNQSRKGLLQFSYVLVTPDGNTLVSEGGAGPARGMDGFLARSIQRTLADYQVFRDKHQITGKGAVLRNF